MKCKNILDCRNEPINFTDEQTEALIKISEFLKTDDQFFLLVGNAGTGKTTIAENIAKYSNALVLAPTNTAVKRLMEKFCDNTFLGHNFSTIHSILYGVPDWQGNFEKKQDKGFPTKATIIIDEVSMLDEFLLADIIKEAISKKNKIIFIGDDFQLEPVGKDPKLFSEHQIKTLFKGNYYKINQVMRNANTILDVATKLRESHIPKILDIENDSFRRVNLFSARLGEQIENNEDYIVLVSTNSTRVKYNNYIRKHRYDDAFNNPIHSGERLISVSNNVYSNGECYVAYQPRIVHSLETNISFKQNGKDIARKFHFYLIEHVDENGNHRKTLLVPDLDLPSLHSTTLMEQSVFSQNPKYAQYSSKRQKMLWKKEINIATYAYAISVHKSQGNEWDHVYIDAGWLAPSWNKARWFYTAITRAKQTIEIKKSNEYELINSDL